MNYSTSLADNVSSVRRLRSLLALIAVGNLMVGVIFVKVGYDVTGAWSPEFNLGLLVLLCGVAAVRCLTMTRGLTKTTGADRRRKVEPALGADTESFDGAGRGATAASATLPPSSPA